MNAPRGPLSDRNETFIGYKAPASSAMFNFANGQGTLSKGVTAMLTNLKIALSVVLVLATASVAIAAPKHAVRHQTTVVRKP